MRTLLVVAVVGCSSAAPRSAVPPSPAPAPDPVASNQAASNQTAPTASRDPAPPTFRLPGDIVPVRYRLEQTIVPDRDSVPGEVQIDATVKRPTSVVWLNAEGLHVTRATIGGRPARVVAGGPMFVGIAADRELPVGSTVIDVVYEATIDRDKSRGIYSEREGKDLYVYTFFEPIDARRAFPCFDEPSYKVPWTLVFHVRHDDVARGNAPIVREDDEAGGMKRVELAESRPMPSYLVAYVVGPFEVVDDGETGRAKTPVAFIVPKGRAGELGYAKEITPRVVVALESYFDMDYPYGKLDVAVVPRYWGTMEHPGIVAMGQPLTLIRPDQATRQRRQSYTNILAHELGHYWFGDYVTLAWWDDAWLNESLGEWSDMNITDAVEPSWHYRDERVGLGTWSMSADEALSARPIHHDVKTTEEIEAAFDNGITYGKGSSVLRAAEAIVGPDKWREFIRAYVRVHAWGNASARDFFGELREQLGDEVADMLQTYVERPGVPRVEVHAACKGSPQINIDESRRALPAGVTDPAPAPWHIPVCVRYGDARHRATTCSASNFSTPFCATWIVPNANANGYYRSVVDPAHLFPKAAKMTAAEKMMTFSDLRAMVDRGELGIDAVLGAMPVLFADPDPRVARWALAASDVHFGGLDEPLYQAGRAWLVRALAPTARTLGYKRGAADDDDRHKLRQSVLRTVARDEPALRTQAEKLADRWLVDRKGVDDDMVDVVLATAAFAGDAARFDRVLAAAKAPRDRTEAQRLLAALAGFTDPALARRALGLTLTSEFDLRESIAIVGASLGQHETRDIALAFLGEHLDDLLAHMRSDEASWLLGEIAGSACDAPRRKTVAGLVTERAKRFDGAQNAVAQGLEQSDRCIAEVTRERPAFEKFLAGHK